MPPRQAQLRPYPLGKALRLSRTSSGGNTGFASSGLSLKAVLHDIHQAIGEGVMGA
jgi:hypothetical protein